MKRGKECTFPGAPSKTRKRALESRLEVLESLVRKLQVDSQDEAIRTLDAIRDGTDIDSLVHAAEASHKSGEASNTDPASTAATSDNPLIQSMITLEPRTSHDANRNVMADKESPNLLLLWKNADDANVEKGVTGFFSCSGKLFHVFTEQQVANYRAVLLSADSLNAQKASAICCIAAVVAIGLQYTHESNDYATEQVFYGIAKHHHDDLIETNALDALKVCSLFAMYNVFGKMTVALAYVGNDSLYLSLKGGTDWPFLDIGLGLCQRMDFENQTQHNKVRWADYRRTR